MIDQSVCGVAAEKWRSDPTTPETGRRGCCEQTAYQNEQMVMMQPLSTKPLVKIGDIGQISMGGIYESGIALAPIQE